MHIYIGRKASIGIHWTQNSSVEKTIEMNLLKYIFVMKMVVNCFFY